MDFAKLPTDNLYKFIAVAGLVMMIVAPLAAYKVSGDLYSEIHMYEREVSDAIMAYHELIQDRSPIRPIDESEDTLDTTTNPLTLAGYVEDEDREGLMRHLLMHDAVIWRLGAYPRPGDTAAKQFFLENVFLSAEEFDKQLLESKPESPLLQTIAKAKALRPKNSHAIVALRDIWNRSDDACLYEWAAIVAFCFGLVTTTSGFLMWYNRVQRFQDTISRIEAAKERASVMPSVPAWEIAG